MSIFHCCHLPLGFPKYMRQLLDHVLVDWVLGNGGLGKYTLGSVRVGVGLYEWGLLSEALFKNILVV